MAPRPTTPFAQALRAGSIDAAPDVAQDPVVVLSPGIHSETAFTRRISQRCWVSLVKARPGGARRQAGMRSLAHAGNALTSFFAALMPTTRIHWIYAPILFGVVGFGGSAAPRNSTVVNTLGSGILENPGLLRFLPQLSERLLDESPLLHTARSTKGIASERLAYWPMSRRCWKDQKALSAGKLCRDRCLHNWPIWQCVSRRCRGSGWGQVPQPSVGAHQPCRGVVVRRGRHATVHCCPAQWPRADDRRPRLCTGARSCRIYARKTVAAKISGCAQRSVRRGDNGAGVGAGQNRSGHLAVSSRVLSGSVLDGPLRRARGRTWPGC